MHLVKDFVLTEKTAESTKENTPKDDCTAMPKTLPLEGWHSDESNACGIAPEMIHEEDGIAALVNALLESYSRSSCPEMYQLVNEKRRADMLTLVSYPPALLTNPASASVPPLET